MSPLEMANFVTKILPNHHNDSPVTNIALEADKITFDWGEVTYQASMQNDFFLIMEMMEPGLWAGTNGTLLMETLLEREFQNQKLHQDLITRIEEYFK